MSGGISIKKVLWMAQAHQCFYCGRFYPKDKRSALTIDHLFPRHAGNGRAMNSVLACKPCNSEKGGREPTPKEIDLARRVWALTIEILRQHHKVLPRDWSMARLEAIRREAPDA